MSTIPRTVIPLYHQLAGLLEQKIDSGEYPPGSQLPTENRLADEYGVSVITVRGAMKLLQDQGRIERFAGRGTFVLDRGAVRAVWGLGSIADIDMTTVRSEMAILATKVVKPPEWVWRAMGLDAPCDVHWMRNVRSVQNERFMVSEIFHHPQLTEIVNTARFRKAVREMKLVVLAVSKLAGIPLGQIRQSLSATLAAGDIARVLLVEAGKPLLVADRLFLSTDGRVLQVGRTHYRVDHYRYSLNLRAIEEPSRTERKSRREQASPKAGQRRGKKS